MKEKEISRRQFIKYSVGTMAALWVATKLPPWAGNPANAQVAPSLNFTITDIIKEMYTHQGPFVVGPGEAPFNLVDLPGSKNNQALQYYWIYKEETLPADSPGPLIFTSEGATLPISVTNALDTPHAFSIPGLPGGGFTTGPIAPAATFTGAINVPALSAGTYLYFDNVNPLTGATDPPTAPSHVGRVMGLHGAFVVMPNPLTNAPFNAADLAANPRLARLFNDLGFQPWFPGLAWDNSNIGGEPAPNGPGLPDTPPFRQFIWLIHEASPLLFAAVGDNTPITFTTVPTPDFPNGRTFTNANPRDPEVFRDAFLNSAFVPGGQNKPPANAADRGFAPQFFTISGQSGHFSHDTPFLCPHLRVGEPCVIRCLNAGLWGHCMHLHANHFYMLRVRNEATGFNRFNAFPDLNPAAVSGLDDNHVLLDVFGAHPLDVWEWTIPYVRPPDVANTLGIGRPDLSEPLEVILTPIRGFGSRVDARGRLRPADTPAGETTWPPVQELNMNIPRVGRVARLPRVDARGRVRFVRAPIHVPLSPMCFPMHDHTEPTQTTQGGNYNTGMINGINFIGDRNADGLLPAPPADSRITVGPGGVLTFPMAPLHFEETRPADVPEAGNPDNTAFPEELLAQGFLDQVFGANFNISQQPPAGPRPPFEEVE